MKRMVLAITVLSLGLLAAEAVAACRAVLIGLEGKAVVELTDSSGATVTLPEDFRPARVPDGVLLPCVPEGNWELVVTMAGFEPRRTTLTVGSADVMLDLRDRGWEPSPVRLSLAPGRLAAQAIAVWVEADRLVTASPREGMIEGPRITPGRSLAVAIVGQVAPRLVTATRDPASEPVVVDLEDGASVVVACHGPFGPTFLQGVVAEAVAFFRSESLDRSTVAVLADAEASGALAVLSVPPRASAIRISHPDAAPLVLRAADLQCAMELTLQQPEPVALQVLSAGDFEPIEALVDVVGLIGDEKLTLASARADEDGDVDVALGRGEYELVAEAPGFETARQELSVPTSEEAVVILMESAIEIRGRVVEQNGLPIPGAGVVAIEGDGAFNSRFNAGQAGPDGRFIVTLPSVDNVHLRVSAPGFADEWVDVSGRTPAGEAPEVDVIMRPSCSLTLQLTAEDGSDIEEQTVALIGGGVGGVRLAQRTARGLYDVAAYAGQWTVLAEEAGAVGSFEVPEVCDGLLIPVVLRFVGAGPTGERERSREESPGTAAWPRGLSDRTLSFGTPPGARDGS